MDAHAILKAYFTGKDIEGNYESFKSVKEYADKLAKKDPDKVKPADVSFMKNDMIDKANKALTKYLKVCRDAEKADIVWPECSRAGDLAKLQKMQAHMGAKSKSRASLLKTCVRNEKKFSLTLKVQWAMLKVSGGLYEHHRELALASKRYGILLEKTFFRLLDIPIGIGSVGPSEFFTMSNQCTTYHGLCDSIAISLKKIEAQNERAIKECVTMIRESKDWLTWMETKSPDDDASLKKSIKAGVPRK